MKYTNAHGLPRSLLWLLSQDNYDGEPGALSVTRLIGSARMRVLQDLHKDELVVDVVDNVYSMLGTAVHEMLGNCPFGMTEHRMSAELNGVLISGKPDRIDDGVLSDFKVCSAWINSLGMYEDWEKQLNCYKWLAEKNDIPVDSLRVVAIFRDWTRSQIDNREGYPEAPVAVYAVPIWSDEQVENYIAERICAHKEAEAGELPECSPYERWERPSVWAVHYNAGKRAKRLLESEVEARNWLAETHGVLSAPVVTEPAGTGYCIVERKGEWRRCEHYCNVSQFCEQWRRFSEPDPET